MDEINGKYAPVKGKIPGQTFNLGGHEFVLAPLNLDGCQKAESLLESFKADNASAKDVIKAGAPILLLSLQRNYDITLEEVEALLDVGNVVSAVALVCGASGFAAGGVKPATQ